MDKQTINRIATAAYNRGISGDCRVHTQDRPGFISRIEAANWQAGRDARDAKRGFVQASDFAGIEWHGIAQRAADAVRK